MAVEVAIHLGAHVEGRNPFNMIICRCDVNTQRISEVDAMSTPSDGVGNLDVEIYSGFTSCNYCMCFR